MQLKRYTKRYTGLQTPFEEVLVVERGLYFATCHFARGTNELGYANVKYFGFQITVANLVNGA